MRYLPAAQEVVCFNRSWYNRAGVERVMGFCTHAEYEEFIETVPTFEQMLARSGIKLIKYYLDITRDEQKERLEDRRKDPLKQWKISPIDDTALDKWDAYTKARNEMLDRTSHRDAPWVVVNANDKKKARLNAIRDILTRIDRDHEGEKPGREIVFEFEPSALKDGRLAG